MLLVVAQAGPFDFLKQEVRLSVFATDCDHPVIHETEIPLAFVRLKPTMNLCIRKAGVCQQGGEFIRSIQPHAVVLVANDSLLLA
jgi:hypothetical protein